MQQHHMVDVAAEYRARGFALESDELARGGAITFPQPRDAFRVLPKPAPRMRAVPEVVLPVERGLRDAVTVLAEERAYGAALLERVALAQEGVSEPTPGVSARRDLRAFRHQQLERRFVAHDLDLKIFDAVLREIEMVVGVVRKRVATRHPDLQRLRAIWISLEFVRVDEAVRRWDAVFLQHLDG